MAKGRRLWTNFSKGELSPRIEGRPDLAAYFEGGKTIENWLLLRQGGLRRRFGTRFIAEVKDSTKDTVLLPFEASVDDAFIVELGHQYMRFYKNKAQIKTSAGGPAVEISSPYTEAQLRRVHFTQSVDVLYLVHPDVAQRKLSRVSDTSWSLSQIKYLPPPTFEDDTDISGGTATLTPGATTGTDVTFTASSAVFFRGDKGRQIIYGASRAVITSVGPSAGAPSPQASVKADILDDFPNTNAIPAGQWFLRLSPQVTLDPDKKEPIGAQVTLVAGDDAFRTADVGKYVFIYGGLVKITSRDSNTQVKGEILSVMSLATAADPAAAAAGAWTLEVESWSSTAGFPRTCEFFQGRLAQASTKKQRTAFWLSEPDDFEGYALGSRADSAVEFTIASRQLNQIEWLADNIDLFIGTSGAELRARGRGSDNTIVGNEAPAVDRLASQGASGIQPVVFGRRILYVDRSLRRILSLLFTIEDDDYDVVEITAVSDHILGTGVRLGHIAFQRRPDPRLWIVRSDGQLVTLTYYHAERVIGFTRIVTDGTFEAVAAIPRPSGGEDEVWVVVKRTIDGVVKRYVEMFEADASEYAGKTETALQTDCAKVYSGSSTTSITGLSYLEGKVVDVIAGGVYKGTKTVSGGAITLGEAATLVEVGLHYDSTGETMRPALEGVVIEGVPRSWDKLWVRLLNSIGGRLNGELLQYPVGKLDTVELFTGDVDVTGYGWDTEGRVKIEQTLPYPMTVLAVFGELSVGDRG